MQLERMKNATGIETDLCGLCFAVCPYTQKYLKGEVPYWRVISNSTD